MPWARIDDMLPLNPKVRALSDGGFRLYLSAICWSSLHTTDGEIPADQLRYVSDVKTPASRAAELVFAGLWEKTDNGWHIHDYLVYQPSAEKIRERRERQAGWQAKWKAKKEGSPEPSPEGSQEGSAEVTPSHPIPYINTSVGTNGSGSSPRPSDLILTEAVRKAIAERTGTDITDDHARTIARQIIGNETVRNPTAYVTAAINRDPNPRRFLPTRQPDPLHREPRRPDQDAITKLGAAAARAALAQPPDDMDELP